MKFIMTKILIKEGCVSRVEKGEYSKGELIVRKENGDIIENADVYDIEEDDMVIVGSAFYFLKCSEIVKIIRKSENEVEFETTTSVYLVEREGEIQ